MVGTVEVNSDPAVWSSDEFENLTRSAQDSEPKTEIRVVASACCI